MRSFHKLFSYQDKKTSLDSIDAEIRTKSQHQQPFVVFSVCPSFHVIHFSHVPCFSFQGGKLEYRKGHDLVIKALQIFLKEHPGNLYLS